MTTQPNPTFTSAEQAALAGLLDVMIPPGRDGRMPGAGQIGLGTRLSTDLAAHPELVAVVRAGLAALDTKARAQGAAAFVSLDPERRAAVVHAQHEHDSSLVSTLLFPVLVGYYEHPRVLEALGVEPRPPFPLGYELPPFDPTLLEPVRKRGRKLYREC